MNASTFTTLLFTTTALFGTACTDLDEATSDETAVVDDQAVGDLARKLPLDAFVGEWSCVVTPVQNPAAATPATWSVTRTADGLRGEFVQQATAANPAPFKLVDHWPATARGAATPHTQLYSFLDGGAMGASFTRLTSHRARSLTWEGTLWGVPGTLIPEAPVAYREVWNLVDDNTYHGEVALEVAPGQIVKFADDDCTRTP